MGIRTLKRKRLLALQPKSVIKLIKQLRKGKVELRKPNGE